ncbi:trace amine-associated receptor 4-like [Rhopilema esculentum]|uniref:trace amine-associated receptor 4-like n=1 Tax=Rhopilema esculentum TaxID=499914 RepID=UPI0031CED54A
MEDNTVNLIIFLILDGIVTILTLVGNGIFIFTLAKKKSLQTPSNILLGALSISDFLVALIPQPLAISTCILRLFDANYITVQYIKLIGSYFCITLSLLYLVSVSVDRYVAICHPYLYMRHATCKRYIWGSIFLFIFGIVFQCIKLIVIRHFAIDGLPILIITATVIAFCNVRIAFVIRKHSRQIFQTDTRFEGDERQQSRTANLDRNKAYVTAMLVICFILCYLPIYVYKLLLSIDYLNVKERWKSQEFSINLWSEFAVYLNSFINPVIYYGRMSLFRRVAREMLCEGKTERQNHLHDTQPMFNRPTGNFHGRHRQEGKRFAQEQKRMNVLHLLILVLLACYLPYWFTRSVAYFRRQLYPVSDADEILRMLTDFALMFNSLLNPILYYARVNEVRVAMRKVFRFHKKNNSE